MAIGLRQQLVPLVISVQQATTVELAPVFPIKLCHAHKESTVLRNLGATALPVRSALTCLTREQRWFQIVFRVSKATNVYQQVK